MIDLTLFGMSGALRAASTNRLLLHEAARRFAPTSFIEGDLRLPLFDGDLEVDGPPIEVQKLAQQISSADAIIVVTPEYNKGISGVLKNALDWISRADGKPFAGKPTAIMSATAGRSGGERSQEMLRWCLTPFQPRLLPGPEVMVAQTSSQWDGQGRLMNVRNAAALDILMSNLRTEAQRLKVAG
ncbi:MAG: NAD(P)H-dependent oxidoreductase [Pseudoprimorskyibacter sp.]|nr:NAD(P)H-dependent oxidoreductase [Pseudoprimorskyibacter sp.]